METIMIKGLRFAKTCSACPEQYDVFDYKNEQVGYVRLRWGWLNCEYPQVFGEVIYSASIGDGLTGCFETEEQRQKHLENIADAILREMQNTVKHPIKKVKCIWDLYSVFGPWYSGYVYDVIKYDEENGEWNILNTYHEPGLVTDKEFREYFERIED